MDHVGPRIRCTASGLGETSKRYRNRTTHGGRKKRIDQREIRAHRCSNIHSFCFPYLAGFCSAEVEVVVQKCVRCEHVVISRESKIVW